MTVKKEEIVRITQDVWANMLQLGVSQSEQDPEVSPESSVTACVPLAGDEWQGAVALECCQTLAAQLAAAMFSMDLARVTQSEIDDVLGELANMIAGTIKRQFPGPPVLAVPFIIRGQSFTLEFPNAETRSAVQFESEGKKFIIRVIEHTRAGHPGHRK